MTAQLPSKVRLAQIASFSKSMALPPSHDEIEAMARFALAAHEQEPVAYMWDSERKDIDEPGFYRPEHLIFAESNVKKYGGKVTSLYAHHAPVPAVPDEIVGWVREENGDSRDPLFLCGSVSPYEGKAYNSQYFPVKRAAMLNGGKS
ncbi:MAG: hypothetical protein E7H83_01975 [Enterobacteriaceae bacterium]|nr:hypothetical protein [Enterobacteriaceae bacterium]